MTEAQRVEFPKGPTGEYPNILDREARRFFIKKCELILDVSSFDEPGFESWFSKIQEENYPANIPKGALMILFFRVYQEISSSEKYMRISLKINEFEEGVMDYLLKAGYVNTHNDSCYVTQEAVNFIRKFVSKIEITAPVLSFKK